jgi:hypothetical protein
MSVLRPTGGSSWDLRCDVGYGGEEYEDQR